MGVRKWWRQHFLLAEGVLAMLFTILTAWWVLWGGGYDAVDSVLDQNRGAVYGALASIFGSLLGFVIAAVAIVLGYAESDRLRLVRESRYYDDLWSTFIASIRILGLATVVSVIALIFDRPEEPEPIVFIAVVLVVVLALFRLGRAVWVLEGVIKIVTRKTLG